MDLLYFICDPPHLIKMTRNCWSHSGWNSTRHMTVSISLYVDMCCKCIHTRFTMYTYIVYIVRMYACTSFKTFPEKWSVHKVETLATTIRETHGNGYPVKGPDYGTKAEAGTHQPYFLLPNPCGSGCTG